MFDLNRIAEWNLRMNDLPRRLGLVLLTLLGVALLVVLLPYCWPFVLALLLSMLLNPLVEWALKKFRKVGRTLVSVIGVVVLCALVFTLAFMVFSRLIGELLALMRELPHIAGWVSTTVIPQAEQLYAQYSDVLPQGTMSLLNSALSSIGSNLLSTAGKLSTSVTTGAVSAVAAIPGVILSIVLTVMGTLYMTIDRERIHAFFRRTFPRDVQKQGLLLKQNFIHSLFGQVKSQLLVSLIIITFLCVSLVLIRVNYGLLIGFLIGIADALPVIGAGLFLIPWCIVSFVMGDVRMGVLIALVYVGTIVIRQITEPRIVGKNLGLYPLATMIAMYAGYVAFGFLGLLGGPILLNLLKVVLEVDASVRQKADEGKE